MAVEIKRAIQSDLDRIAELFDDYRVFYKQSSDKKLALKFITERFNNNESVIFYAIDTEGNYVGFTQLYPSFSSVSAQRCWVLNDLYVSKDVRSLGVGTLLLNKAKNYAIKTNTKGLKLETGKDNIGAQKLYQKLGYKKDTDFSYFLSV